MPRPTRIVIVDTNLFLLLVVGSADRRYIASHPRLGDYTVDDFELLGLWLTAFDRIVVIAHVLTEVSNLLKMRGPAGRHLASTFKTLVETLDEITVSGRDAVAQPAFIKLGLADAALLHVCSALQGDARPTLLTADGPLASQARSLGCTVIHYDDPQGFE